MRDARQFSVDLHSDKIKVLAAPSDMITCRYRFSAVATHAIDILIEVGYVVEGLVTSHLHCSEDPFFFFFKVVRDTADVVIDFEWCPAAPPASSSVSFASVPGSSGSFQDEWLEVLAEGFGKAISGVRHLSSCHATLSTQLVGLPFLSD